MKITQIATSISSVRSAIGQTYEQKQTVAIDENGNAWILELDLGISGTPIEWKPLPQLPECICVTNNFNKIVVSDNCEYHKAISERAKFDAHFRAQREKQS